MSDFYITLPSNSSMGYYPDNTLAAFTTMLPNAIDLKGDWEVALKEIQYPHNWYNVPMEESYRSFTITSNSARNPDGAVGVYPFTINEGYYPSIQHLSTEIAMKANQAMNRTGNQISFDYNNVQRKMIANVGNSIISIPPHIRRMMGMSFPEITRSANKSDNVIDLDPIDALYVYCDIVEPRVVGDIQTPLLRIVPVEGDNGELVTRIYENGHYIRVQKKSFQTVEINIMDRTGNKVAFEQGTLNVTLHFRQRKRLSSL